MSTNKTLPRQAKSAGNKPTASASNRHSAHDTPTVDEQGYNEFSRLNMADQSVRDSRKIIGHRSEEDKTTDYWVG